MNSRTIPYIGALRRRLAGLTIVLGAVLAIGWWVDRGRMEPIPEAGDLKLDCVSYAPFRRPGETPFDPLAFVSPQRIEQDLRILRARTDCVRTYAVHQGLEAVPEVARRLGMRVKLGAWIGRDAAANAIELDRAIALTHTYRDVVDLLIVGNEVLLRRELTPPVLSGLLARARRESAVPVSYADVWEFWLRNDGLRGQVDLVTVHILPYWEDEPVAIGQAVEHVFSIAAKVKQHFAGTPVLVGETGWPAAGRQRAGAVPGRVNQARFAREFVARASRESLSYNFIEGFDQPWKRRLEGAMGGRWGLFDRDGVLHFAWSGALQEDPRWWYGPLAAALVGLVGCIAWVRRRREAFAGGLLALAWTATGALAVAHWQYMNAWCLTPLDWVVSGLAALFALLCALLGADRLSVVTGGSRQSVPTARARDAAASYRTVPPAEAASREAEPGIARALRGRAISGRAFALCRAATLFAAAVTAIALVFDPRYRGFPWALFAAPALVFLALRIAGERLHGDAREERLLAAVIALCAPVIVWIEGVHNAQAIGFALLLVVLAGASAWPYRVCGPARERGG